jgi:hypothetical protein
MMMVVVVTNTKLWLDSVALCVSCYKLRVLVSINVSEKQKKSISRKVWVLGNKLKFA